MGKRQMCLLALLCATAGVGADVVWLNCGCPKVKPELHGTFWRNSLTQNLAKLPPRHVMLASQEGRHVYSARNLFVRYGTTGAWPGLPEEVSDNFVDVHKGFVNVTETGSYSFHLSCEQGAVLVIDGQVVVDFDGLHPMQSLESAYSVLEEGLHSLEVWHFAGTGTSGLVLRWTLAGGALNLVPAAQLSQCDCDTEAPVPPSTPRPLPPVEGGELAQLRADLIVVRDTVTALDTKMEQMRRDLADVRAAVHADRGVVDRLKGAVGAVTRQLIAYENRMQERVRAEGNSGLTVVRAFGQGSDAYHKASFTETGPANAHNHANTEHTIGLGEFGAVLNGVQFTTRHNDYSLRQPMPGLAAAEYTKKWPPETTNVTFPSVPPSVLAKGTVEEQAREMRYYFEAFHRQNSSIRDYDEYFKPNLCYLEGAWTEAQDAIAEPFASERHQIDADTWEDLNDKNDFLFNNGRKSLKENLPYLPTAFRAIHEAANGDVFEPRIGQWFYRISCVPIKERVPTKRFRVANNLHQQARQGPQATKETHAQTDQALFEVNPTLDNYDEEAAWPKGHTKVEYLDKLMDYVPGFDGPRGKLEDTAFGTTAVGYGDFSSGKSLNTAFYTRYYSLASTDAMGQRNQQRAYNDLMWAAQTTHKRISPQQACIDAEQNALTNGKDAGRVGMCMSLGTQQACGAHKGWGEDEVDGGASGAKCVWVDSLVRKCRYKKCWEQRWSYAIPLEVVYTTPLSNWNPHDIALHTGGEGFAAVTANKADGSSPERAFNGTNSKNFFRTPAEFFKNRKEEEIDPADTSGEVTFVKDRSGKVQRVRASGHWLVFPEIEGVGRVRQRYPIMPVHEHGSTTWKEVKAVQELVLGKIASETPASAHAQELELTEGMGHVHRLTVSPADLHLLKTGEKRSARIVSSTDSAHSHYVEVDYDPSRSPGAEFGLVWCATGNEQAGACLPKKEDDPCTQTENGNMCCYGKCPDTHGLRVVV